MLTVQAEKIARRKLSLQGRSPAWTKCAGSATESPFGRLPVTRVPAPRRPHCLGRSDEDVPCAAEASLVPERLLAW